MRTAGDAMRILRVPAFFHKKAIAEDVRLARTNSLGRCWRTTSISASFCGLQPTGLDASGMLIASHVKPWAKCDNSRERLDPGNGIAASPIHDKAFDSGLLTVNGGCRIHLAANLELRIPMDKALGYFFGADILPERLRVPPGRSGPGRRYLDYHGEHVFMGAR